MTVLLHGYYDRETATQHSAMVNVEFRTALDVPDPDTRYEIELDESGNSGTIELEGLSSGSYYLLVRHQLSGQAYGGGEMTLGSNHLPVISSVVADFNWGEETTVNFSDPEGVGYVEPWISIGASGPMILLGEDPIRYGLAGGDANGDRSIDTDDIEIWNAAMSDSDAMRRGDEEFSEQVDFDGDGVVTFRDFGVWLDSMTRGVTSAPLPEEAVEPTPTPAP